MSAAEPTSAAALRRALAAVRDMRARIAASEQARTEPIAIVGMACRFPGGANSPQAFWELLRDGVDAISEVPDGRTVPEPGATGIRWGGYLDHIDLFDAGFFGISPREANQMDPQQRIMLEVAWEALDSAGQTAECLAGSQTGVFVGMHSHSNDYAWLQFSDPDGIDTYTGTGTSHSVVAGRVSYLLDLRGPSVTVDTACSSSLVAVHLASQSLRGGECRLALAGGVNLVLAPHFTVATTRMQMMSADGRCKTFDASADGFVRGEGCGVVVLKRLSDAQRDGDPVLAVIRGSAVNQDGRTNGLTAPSGLSQQAVIQQALRNAGTDPAVVGAVEAHGTGTALGDPVEMEALAEVFGPAGATSLPVAVGSVKTNIGHLEAAAGVAGLIRTVLSLRHGAIPPNPHLRALNPDITLDGTRLTIPTAARPWPRQAAPRCATVSSFGWSGTNGCVVVAEAPPAAPPAGIPPERPELLPISARSPQALRALAESYRTLLSRDGDGDGGECGHGGDGGECGDGGHGGECGDGGHGGGEGGGEGDTTLYDLCYSAGVRRSHHPFRLAVAGRSRGELADRLAALLADDPTGLFVPRAAAPEPPAGLVFVFCGQGAQWATMGRALLDQEPVFAETLRHCDEILRGYADWSLLDELAADAAASRLDRTEIAQPALFAIQVALAALWRSWGVRPEAVIGHSVGEVAAAHVAGVLPLEDAARVAFHRGRVMQQAHGGGRMATVSLPVTAAEELVSAHAGLLAVAAVNSPNSTVLSGDAEALREVLAAAGARGVFNRMLPVRYAFHSPQMEPLRVPLERALGTIATRPAAVPIVSTVTGRWATDRDFTAEYWGRNIREPVQFAAALDQLPADTDAAFLEIGPRPALARAIAEHAGHHGRAAMVLASMREGADPRTTLLTALGTLYTANAGVDWQRLYPVPGRCVPLPSYPWQRERYWLAPPKQPGPALPQPAGAAQHPLPQPAGAAQHPLPQPAGAAQHPLPQPAAAAQHPLLGRRARCAVPTFENEVSVAIPYLDDHRIHGTALMPLTGYLELALAAGFPDAHGQVSDLVLSEALVLPDGGARSVQVVLTPGGGGPTVQVVAPGGGDPTVQVVAPGSGGPTVQVYSQPAAADGTRWTLHATGTLRRDHSEPDGDRLDFAALQARMAPVEVAEFYRQLRTAGIQYGPACTGLAQLWRGAGEAFGQAVLPRTLEVDGAAYRWHPALLDACLQVALAALPGDVPEVYLPIGLDHFETWAPPGTVVYSHARLRQHSGEAAAVDVRLYTPDGCPVGSVAGMRLRRTGRHALLRATGQPVPGLLYELVWEATAPARPPAPAGTGDWLVVADRGGCGAALKALLESRGERVEMFGRERAARRVPGGPWRGIVYLAALDATAEEPTADQIMSAHEDAVRDLLDLVRALTASEAAAPRLWLVTRGARAVLRDTPTAVAQSAVWGLATAIRCEYPQLRCTCVDLDPADTGPRVETLHDLLRAGGEEDQIAVRGGRVHACRLVPATAAAASPWPTPARPARLEIGETRLLEHLTRQPLERRAPGPDEVEIRVHATGLNFRDVLNALGMYPGDAGPLGLECAGEVVAVGPGVRGLRAGDRVVALAAASFATFTTVAARRVARMPEALGFAEAATIPVAFLTATYGLHRLAQMRSGERVLIHAAAGGVGLAAVQLAALAGAEVFATASPAKWPLLREGGVRHVFNSRTLDFASEIRKRTGGDGVHVVLNALAGEFIPRSLDILGPGGRFIEIGKRNIWPADRAARYRPDVRYHPFDLGTVADADPALLHTLLHDLMRMCDENRLTPLPLREFGFPHAVDAFRYMARARHAGKVVVGHQRPRVVRADATYLVTGGLGAIGLAISRWLVDQGARHLVLLGRRGAAGPVAAALGDRHTGVEVVARRVDVSDRPALSDVLAEIATTMPPLRGIVHAAGLLDDGVLERQTWQRFARVLAPKVAGGWHLHELTRDLELDFFVLCSSVASLLGSAGQGNYVTANAFLDALAHHRRSLGLPATSVNWGPWAGAGMAADSGIHRRLAAQGLQALTADEATRVLGQLLESRPAQVAAVLVDWPTYLRAAGTAATPLFARVGEAGPDGRAGTGTARPGAGTAQPQSAARARIEAAHPGERRRLLHEYVQSQAARILELPPNQPLHPRQPLHELGLDSLMAVELGNALGRIAGRSLPSTLVFEHPTVSKLADYLLGELFPGAEDATAPVSDDQVGGGGDPDVLARVAALDDVDVEALLAERLSALDLGRTHE